jgi:HEAT repeat protein
MAGTSKAPPVPKPVQLFVIRLSTSMKALRLYPTGSDIPRRGAVDALEALVAAIGDDPYLELGVGRDGLHYQAASVFPRSESFTTFAREFYKRNLAAVRFHGGASPDEILLFLSLIIQPPEQVAAAGGMETGLSELGVINITVSEAATRIVETAIPGSLPAPRDENDESERGAVAAEADFDEDTAKSIEQILEEAGADQARDRRLLMRALRDKRAVADYLREARSRGPEDTVKDLAKRIGALARSTRKEMREDRSAALSVIAEAISELSPQERGELYQDHLIEQARRDQELAELIDKLGVDELVDRILDQIDETPEALTGLSRAVRNLTLMNVQAPGSTVLNLVVSTMQTQGKSEGFISGMTTAANPTRITGMQQFKTGRSESVGTVLRLIDMTPDGSDVFVFDEAVEPLRAEAARGTTDGDVIESLVSVAMMEQRDDQFSSVMTMLEDSVGYLIEAQEAHVAADVAEAMSAASKDERLSEAHRARMSQILRSIARPDSLAAVASVLRRYKSDSPEYVACRRLIAVLGESVIDPLLEVLANEDDMAARKALIEMISVSAGNYIPELGARLSDRRWYLVRNVVSILASTHSPEALPYLQRTLRHNDARVRRETIRGFAAIRSGMSDSLLTAALDDDDAQNVEIAAKYLGSLGCVSGVSALELVARGQNHGNHDEIVRIAAVEALARIGEASSVPVFQELARKRGFLFFGRNRDKALRAAAVEALRVAQPAASAKGASS